MIVNNSVFIDQVESKVRHLWWGCRTGGTISPASIPSASLPTPVPSRCWITSSAHLVLAQVIFPRATKSMTFSFYSVGSDTQRSIMTPTWPCWLLSCSRLADLSFSLGLLSSLRSLFRFAKSGRTRLLNSCWCDGNSRLMVHPKKFKLLLCSVLISLLSKTKKRQSGTRPKSDSSQWVFSYH